MDIVFSRNEINIDKKFCLKIKVCGENHRKHLSQLDNSHVKDEDNRYKHRTNIGQRLGKDRTKEDKGGQM